MLTKIIYKNFRSNFKNYVAFFIRKYDGCNRIFCILGFVDFLLLKNNVCKFRNVRGYIGRNYYFGQRDNYIFYCFNGLFDAEFILRKE